MKKVTFAVMGMGDRGTEYAKMQLKYPKEMEVTAIADVDPLRLQAANQFLHLPENRLFASGEEMAKKPNLADVMVISTQDQQHCEHAILAMQNGYHLLLEKPIATNEEDVRKVLAAAEKYNRTVIVCHVLRYTPFYRKIRELILDGTLGKIESIDAAERIGYYHFAHSYVRGNWNKFAVSSSMLLAKSGHDMDIIYWLTGKKCKKVSSFGSLDHFNAANCPEGAAERCSDGCPVKDCPYNAVDFYLSRMPEWPANVLSPEPNEENIMRSLRTTDYGRCVYQLDNDVVDHQAVNLLLEDGVVANFSVSAFTGDIDRTIHVMGTKGEVYGKLSENRLTLCVFGTDAQTIDLARFDDARGHGGGDEGMIYDLIRLMRGDRFDTDAVSFLMPSAESHFICFAAEQSRLQNGTATDVDAY